MKVEKHIPEVPAPPAVVRLELTAAEARALYWDINPETDHLRELESKLREGLSLLDE
ncbi:hypothetical protein ACQPZJ_35645 [Actinoplanes sp. CA-054009]